jgi:Leucine-rich repeat (LRR) protein
LYDTVEPNVLKEDFLAEVVREQKPRGEAGRLAAEEGIEFNEVTVLRLDFRNILRIDNLWQFQNLTKLQLDNNIIEEIKGLEVLVHLEWLDLSFNNIERIEGLGSLQSLQDLSLSHNRIKVIEELDNLHSLQVFSIGYNFIESVENVLYLRQFKKLSSLNIANNPLCDSSEHTYPQFLLATLPQLVYLDFRYITPEAREEACEAYQELLDSLELKDREVKRKAAEDSKLDAKLTEYKEAYVDGLDELQLFQAMFEEDKDLEQIRLIPGIPEMLTEFEKKFELVCHELVQEGLIKSTKRIEERSAFFHARKEACEHNKKAALNLLAVYEQVKAQLLASVEDQDQLQSVMDALSKEHHRLKEELLRIEMELVEQVDVSLSVGYIELIHVSQAYSKPSLH